MIRSLALWPTAHDISDIVLSLFALVLQAVLAAPIWAAFTVFLTVAVLWLTVRNRSLSRRLASAAVADTVAVSSDPLPPAPVEPSVVAVAPPPEPASPPPATGTASTPDPVVAVFQGAVGRVDALRAEVAASPDFQQLDGVCRISPSMAALIAAIEHRGAEHLAMAAVTSALRTGVEGAGWLHNLIRARLILQTYAPPGSPLHRLGTALNTVDALAQGLLAEAGLELTVPGLLTPAGRGHEIADDAASRLQTVAFARRAVQASAGSSHDSGNLIVDCLKCGVRVSPGPGQPARHSPAVVALYAPMTWQRGG